MKTKNRQNQLVAVFGALVSTFCSGGAALAVDDGARAYWSAREGTNVVSFQYLNMDISTGTKDFAPGQYIYPNSDVDADMFVLNWMRYITVFDRASSLNFALPGGNLDINSSLTAPTLLPPGVAQGSSFSESASGYGDPSLQFTLGLFGEPKIKSTVDQLNYEPTWTLSLATMLAAPIGEYSGDQLANIGQNRWYGRVALPFKYHLGTFSPGYRTSFELTPSVWLFGDNDDFLGQNLKNDPLWQLEAHLTHDFTDKFYGSLDVLYRGGYQSEIDGRAVGSELGIGNVGFTLNYQVSDNAAIRAGYSSDVFGDSDLDTSMFRIGFVFGWNKTMENAKKLQSGH
jgi:hypothetical protein